MLNKDIILKDLAMNKVAITAYGVKEIGLFGSFASGGDNENSDVDFLVEFESGKKSFDNYMNLKFFLEGLYNRKVDLVIKENIKPALKNNILGSVVYVSGVQSLL